MKLTFLQFFSVCIVRC